MPHFSLIVVSHNKPKYVRQAIQSVLDQTHQDWEALVLDSGILLNQGFFSYLHDPRLTVISTGETPEFARTRNMASWCYNHALNSGRLRGELLMYLCDDDILYPVAFQTFWDFYASHNQEPDAMYASLDRGFVDAAGQNHITSRLIADRPAGRHCHGRKLDCQVDGLQFCHSARILEQYRQTYQTTTYHSEDKRDAHHGDGIFMEQIGALTTVHHINTPIGMNRRTTESVNLDYSSSPAGRFIALMKAKLKGARRFFGRR